MLRHQVPGIADSGFSPIGSSSTAFEGSYDGDGYTISGLFINRSSNNIGLFGFTDDATITNLGVIEADITGNNFSGILCGQCDASTITNTFTTGSITGNNSVGGLGGFIYGSGSSISRIYSTAIVSGASQVGGLIGDFRAISLSFSYASGDVSGATNVGGLLGYMINNQVADSYATGNVTGSGSNIGGLIGQSAIGMIYRVYSSGMVSGGSTVGGLIGFLSSGLLNNGYWNTETSGVLVGAGSNTSSDTPVGLTNDEMFLKSSFSGFNFNNRWEIQPFSFSISTINRP